MPLFHIAVLALIQGITEFLPVSSSGHLALVPFVTGWEDQGLALDVAVHVGTLGAVMAYLWRDLAAMILGLARLLRGRVDAGGRLAGLVVLGTLPVVGAGYLVHAQLGGALRTPEVIAWATLGFGVVLWLADRVGMTLRRLEHLGAGGALFIGLAQVLALIPGTSRSGITMTAARLLGYERPEAARFSMLLAIPAILGAGTLAGLDLWRAGDPVMTSAALTAAGLAFVAALAAVALMMAWLRRATFTPFVVYRLILGAGLLALIYAP